MERAITTRAASTVLFIPGRGTKMKTPAIRARVSRKPRSVEFERRSSLPIAAQVPENQDCIRRHLLQHPWQREDKGGQKREQAGNGVEPGILDRSHDLDQTDNDAHDE